MSRPIEKRVILQVFITYDIRPETARVGNYVLAQFRQQGLVLSFSFF